MKALFIGGSADGQWIHTNGESHWQIASSAPAATVSEMPYKLNTETYCKEVLRTEEGDIFFYVGDNLTADQAIRALFAGYRQPTHRIYDN